MIDSVEARDRKRKENFQFLRRPFDAAQLAPLEIEAV